MSAQTNKLAVLTAMIGLVSSPTISADDGAWFGYDAAGTWMAGAKYGTVRNGKEDFDQATNSTIMLGYMFDRPVYGDGTAAIELELSQTTENGEIGPRSGIGVGEWNNDGTSLFLAYRTPGTVYFKAKIGAVVADRNYTVVKDGRHHVYEDQEFGLSWGAGLGVHLGERANLEVEYTVPVGMHNSEELGANDTSYLSGGFNLNF